MTQVLVTPHAIYKWFRAITLGFVGDKVEAGGFYVKQVVKGPVTSLKYFKFGTGAGALGGILTRSWFDINIKDNNTGLGDVKTPLQLYATDPEGYQDKYTKELFSADFYPYSGTDDSKVAGVLGVTPNAGGVPPWWNMPGVMFQVGCRIGSSEGNFPGPAANLVNEIGIYDEDDVLMLYGVFDSFTKDSSTTLKANCVAMTKLLDFQLT